MMTTYLLSVGTENVAVAAPSKRAALAALNAAGRNWSMYSFNLYHSTLRDDHEIAVMCLAAPGTVFTSDNRHHRAPWSVAS